MGMTEDITQIWEEVFGIDSIRTDDDFFSLGGDSLTAIQIASLIQQKLDTGGVDDEAILLALFDHSVFAAFVDVMNDLRVGQHRDA